MRWPICLVSTLRGSKARPYRWRATFCDGGQQQRSANGSFFVFGERRVENNWKIGNVDGTVGRKREEW